MVLVLLAGMALSAGMATAAGMAISVEKGVLVMVRVAIVGAAATAKALWAMRTWAARWLVPMANLKRFPWVVGRPLLEPAGERQTFRAGRAVRHLDPGSGPSCLLHLEAYCAPIHRDHPPLGSQESTSWRSRSGQEEPDAEGHRVEETGAL